MGEEVPLLDRDNQSKNPSVINKMDGANDANDTPVSVEAEARSNREVVNIPFGKSSPSLSSNNINQIEAILEVENQSKNPEEEVKIPIGKPSRKLNIITQESPKETFPGIYKKGECSPRTELPTVMPNMDGAHDANDTPVSVEAEAKSYREIIETSNELPTITSKRRREEEKKILEVRKKKIEALKLNILVKPIGVDTRGAKNI